MTTAKHVIAVVGSGAIAQRHVRNLLGLGELKLAVVTQRDVTGVDAFDHERVRVVSEVPDDVFAAIVANETGKHVATTRALVDRGVHVLIEKPVAAAVDDELQRLCMEAQATGVIVRVAYNMRLLPAMGRIADAVAAGVLGTLLFARIEVGQWLPDWRPSRPVHELYAASSDRGGGVALDLSHELDYMYMLFGTPRSWRVQTSNTGVLGIDTPEVFEGVYSYDQGFLCSVHLDYLERQKRRQLRLVGSKAVLECDFIAGKLSILAADEATVETDDGLFDMSATYLREVESFLNEARGVESGSYLPDCEEATSVLSLLEDSHE